jgi:hypothetical protein
MLRLLQLVEQFIGLERRQEEGWTEVTLELTLADESQVGRSTALLAPAAPARFGRKIRFTATRGGGGAGPEAVRRLLRGLDRERIQGTLEVVAAQKAPSATPHRRTQLREQWEKQLAHLPADWSDLYAQVTFDSTDYLEPAALLVAPLNPSRVGSGATFRFRAAHRFGYGVSPEMGSRCFARCDEQGITGRLEILHVLSDTQPVGTQGPVWLLGGRTV